MRSHETLCMVHGGANVMRSRDRIRQPLTTPCASTSANPPTHPTSTNIKYELARSDRAYYLPLRSFNIRAVCAARGADHSELGQASARPRLDLRECGWLAWSEKLSQIEKHSPSRAHDLCVKRFCRENKGLAGAGRTGSRTHDLSHVFNIQQYIFESAANVQGER